MPSYFEPDLTGQHTDYFNPTNERIVHKASQIIQFDMPVYHNSLLEVYIVDGLPILLTEGTDWTVLASDIDNDSISRMKVIDPTFNLVLLSSITIIRPYVDDYNIQIKFNQLYPNTIDYAPININNQIELTPTLVSNMVEQLAYLRNLVMNRADEFSVQSDVIKILDEDRNKTNNDNMILDEVHDINTMDNVAYIRPMYGTFFKDSVVVRNNISNVVYTEGTDYEIIEADLAKTSVTSNASGVYRTIKVTAQVVGELSIDYHAFGNMVDVLSMQTAKSKITAIDTFLADSAFVTPDTLKADPTITNISDKLMSLEGMMRILLQNGIPTYGDVSTGNSATRALSAADNNFHWWNLATLYQVDGSTTFIKSDTFKFRIAFSTHLMKFECDVNVDVDGNTETPMRVTCSNANVPKNVLDTVTPKLRVIYGNAGANYEGVILQIGFTPIGMNEVIAIEDMSGRESCWMMLTDANVTSMDDIVLMPDGVTVWNSINDSECAVHVPLVPDVSVTRDTMDVVVPVTDFGNAVTPVDITGQMYSRYFTDVTKSDVRSLVFNLIVNGNPVVVRGMATVDTVGNTLYSSPTFGIDGMMYTLVYTDNSVATSIAIYEAEVNAALHVVSVTDIRVVFAQ